MLGAGLASVRFQNGKGDAFMADYEFRFSPEETLASALTASFTVSVGILQADFSTEASHEYIASKYEGIFHNRGVSAWIGSAQYASDDKGLWRGGELGLSLGKGATIGRIGFEYERVGEIRPVVQQATENYYRGRYGPKVSKRK